jgi:hypothetical protein
MVKINVFPLEFTGSNPEGVGYVYLRGGGPLFHKQRSFIDQFGMWLSHYLKNRLLLLLLLLLLLCKYKGVSYTDLVCGLVMTLKIDYYYYNNNVNL